MKKAVKVVGALAAIALAATGCGGGSTNNPPGQAGKTLVIGYDLPFQGSSNAASVATENAMKLYLKQLNGKVGNFTIELKKYDNSTAAKGSWDDAQCTKNANEHVANANEVAVMGTYNSGCAKLEAPVLNQAPDGPMLMVSHANTNDGLTKTWDPGEPDKYFPSGKRSYARVVTTDSVQGPAAAQFAKQDLNVTSCLVLDDTETYGKGVANAFAAEAEKQGVKVLRDSWKKADANYTALMGKGKAANVDCVFFGGVNDNNGDQLTKDKVAVLGDNTKVKLITPDGFVGYPDFQKLPQADGAFLTFAGLSIEPLRAAGGKPAQFLDAYKAEYGADPVTAYAVYAVQALQVILEAVKKSDGTRKGVRDAVFEGAGITIPAGDAILGKEVKIDQNGDVSAKDISVIKVSGGKEVFEKAWPVT